MAEIRAHKAYVPRGDWEHPSIAVEGELTAFLRSHSQNRREHVRTCPACPYSRIIQPCTIQIPLRHHMLSMI